MSKQLSNFCFTLNNYNDEIIEFVINKLEQLCSYFVIGKEVAPETKTPHLQGYCELKNRVRFKKMKKFLFNAHIETRKGNATQASDYCKKEENFIEFGTISKQGERNDLKKFVQDVRDMKDNNFLIDNHTGIMCRYHRFANQIRTAKCEKLSKDMHKKNIEVVVLWGKPGTGKTRHIYDLYDESEVYCPDLSTSTTWWDGYVGQKILLLDDFYGQINYAFLLRLLDRYKIQLPVKGGFTYKAWECVYITSNSCPDRWYQNDNTKALSRRLSVVINKNE